MTTAARPPDPQPLLPAVPRLDLAACSEAELIDRVAELEAAQHSLAAAQAEAIRAFARRHVATQTKAGATDAAELVDPERLERSVAGQVALACRVSHAEGRRRIRVARDLRNGLDRMRELFAAGRLSWYKVSVVVEATAHLDARERAEVDRMLAAHSPDRLGVGRLRQLARSLAAQVAPEKFRARVTAARSGRRVTLRPSADGMADLTAHLPVEQGVACLAALHAAFAAASISPEPMTRSRGQLMADTLVERLTGRADAEQVDLDIQVLVPLRTLVDPASPLPAEIPGHGPVPTDLLTTGSGRKLWRRLVTDEGIVIGGDSARRRYGGRLAALIRARDGHRCTEPYCDAPARETDHIRPWRTGGRTTFRNGRAVCVLHNQLRETPGWRVDRTGAGVRTTTPTGHRYTAPIVRRPEDQPPVQRR